MDWSTLPSLSALRAFEAAARLGSHSKAAAELNVTHAAIAQHVRALEAELGAELLYRSGRGMAPTALGASLAGQLSDGFGIIAAGVRDARKDQDDGPLTLTTTFAFAENWLMPRLPDLWSRHPDLRLSITPSTDVVDLRRQGFDFGVRFGRGVWPGVNATLLGKADQIVVGTPEFAKKVPPGNLNALKSLPWLFDLGYPESLAWLEAQGLDPQSLDHRDLPTQSMLLSALRAGGGLSAVNRIVVHDDIAAGRLVSFYENSDNKRGYYLIQPEGVPHRYAKTFRHWVIDQSKPT